MTRFGVRTKAGFIRHAKHFSYGGGTNYAFVVSPAAARLYTRRSDAEQAARIVGGEVVEATVTFA